MAGKGNFAEVEFLGTAEVKVGNVVTSAGMPIDPKVEKEIKAQIAIVQTDMRQLLESQQPTMIHMAGTFLQSLQKAVLFRMVQGIRESESKVNERAAVGLESAAVEAKASAAPAAVRVEPAAVEAKGVIVPAVGAGEANVAPPAEDKWANWVREIQRLRSTVSPMEFGILLLKGNIQVDGVSLESCLTQYKAIANDRGKAITEDIQKGLALFLNLPESDPTVIRLTAEAKGFRQYYISVMLLPFCNMVGTLFSSTDAKGISRDTVEKWSFELALSNIKENIDAGVNVSRASLTDEVKRFQGSNFDQTDQKMLNKALEYPEIVGGMLKRLADKAIPDFLQGKKMEDFHLAFQNAVQAAHQVVGNTLENKVEPDLKAVARSTVFGLFAQILKMAAERVREGEPRVSAFLKAFAELNTLHAKMENIPVDYFVQLGTENNLLEGVKSILGAGLDALMGERATSEISVIDNTLHGQLMQRLNESKPSTPQAILAQLREFKAEFFGSAGEEGDLWSRVDFLLDFGISNFDYVRGQAPMMRFAKHVQELQQQDRRLRAFVGPRASGAAAGAGTPLADEEYQRLRRRHQTAEQSAAGEDVAAVTPAASVDAGAGAGAEGRPAATATARNVGPGPVVTPSADAAAVAPVSNGAGAAFVSRSP